MTGEVEKTTNEDKTAPLVLRRRYTAQDSWAKGEKGQRKGERDGFPPKIKTRQTQNTVLRGGAFCEEEIVRQRP